MPKFFNGTFNTYCIYEKMHKFINFSIIIHVILKYVNSCYLKYRSKYSLIHHFDHIYFVILL